MASGSDEEALFAEAMGKVQRLRMPERAVVGKKRPGPARRPVSAPAVARQATVAADIRPPSADEPWILLANGVSRERLKRLAAGQPPVARSFDLHGVTRDEALAMLEEGFGQALASGWRVVCIIHGRGLHSQGRPVLKQATYHWLREGPYAASVLAVVPQPGSGGGACLVLLRRQAVRT